MTPQQAREQIGFALKRAAPGSDIDTIDPDAELRDALDLDSLDFLRFIEILSETSGRRIEEDDYPKLATLDSSIRFLAVRLPPGGQDGYLIGADSACCAPRGKRSRAARRSSLLLTGQARHGQGGGGSVHHQPAQAFKPVPARVAAEVNAQNAVSAESAISTWLARACPVCLLARARAGMTSRAAAAIASRAGSPPPQSHRADGPDPQAQPPAIVLGSAGDGGAASGGSPRLPGRVALPGRYGQAGTRGDGGTAARPPRQPLQRHAGRPAGECRQPGQVRAAPGAVAARVAGGRHEVAVPAVPAAGGRG